MQSEQSVVDLVGNSLDSEPDCSSTLTNDIEDEIWTEIFLMIPSHLFTIFLLFRETLVILYWRGRDAAHQFLPKLLYYLIFKVILLTPVTLVPKFKIKKLNPKPSHQDQRTLDKSISRSKFSWTWNWAKFSLINFSEIGGYNKSQTEEIPCTLLVYQHFLAPTRSE